MNLKRRTARRGVCSRTDEEHRFLRGRLNDDKTVWTDVAEPYSERMRGVIAKRLRPQVRGGDERVENYSRYSVRKWIREGGDSPNESLMPMIREPVNRVAICSQVIMNDLHLTIEANNEYSKMDESRTRLFINACGDGGYVPGGTTMGQHANRSIIQGKAVSDEVWRDSLLIDQGNRTEVIPRQSRTTAVYLDIHTPDMPEFMCCEASCREGNIRHQVLSLCQLCSHGVCRHHRVLGVYGNMRWWQCPCHGNVRNFEQVVPDQRGLQPLREDAGITTNRPPNVDAQGTERPCTECSGGNDGTLRPCCGNESEGNSPSKQCLHSCAYGCGDMCTFPRGHASFCSCYACVGGPIPPMPAAGNYPKWIGEGQNCDCDNVLHYDADCNYCDACGGTNPFKPFDKDLEFLLETPVDHNECGCCGTEIGEGDGICSRRNCRHPRAKVCQGCLYLGTNGLNFCSCCLNNTRGEPTLADGESACRFCSVGNVGFDHWHEETRHEDVRTEEVILLRPHNDGPTTTTGITKRNEGMNPPISGGRCDCCGMPDTSPFFRRNCTFHLIPSLTRHLRCTHRCCGRCWIRIQRGLMVYGACRCHILTQERDSESLPFGAEDTNPRLWRIPGSLANAKACAAQSTTIVFGDEEAEPMCEDCSGSDDGEAEEQAEEEAQFPWACDCCNEQTPYSQLIPCQRPVPYDEMIRSAAVNPGCSHLMGRNCCARRTYDRGSEIMICACHCAPPISARRPTGTGSSSSRDNSADDNGLNHYVLCPVLKDKIRRARDCIIELTEIKGWSSTQKVQGVPRATQSHPTGCQEPLVAYLELGVRQLRRRNPTVGGAAAWGSSIGLPESQAMTWLVCSLPRHIARPTIGDDSNERIKLMENTTTEYMIRLEIVKRCCHSSDEGRNNAVNQHNATLEKGCATQNTMTANNRLCSHCRRAPIFTSCRLCCRWFCWRCALPRNHPCIVETMNKHHCSIEETAQSVTVVQGKLIFGHTKKYKSRIVFPGIQITTPTVDEERSNHNTTSSVSNDDPGNDNQNDGETFFINDRELDLVRRCAACSVYLPNYGNWSERFTCGHYYCEECDQYPYCKVCHDEMSDSTSRQRIWENRDYHCEITPHDDLNCSWCDMREGSNPLKPFEEPVCSVRNGKFFIQHGTAEEPYDTPPYNVCEICGEYGRVPFRWCSFCGDSPSWHHGRCCPQWVPRRQDLGEGFVPSALLEDEAVEIDDFPTTTTNLAMEATMISMVSISDIFKMMDN